MMPDPHHYHYFATANSFPSVFDQMCKDILSDGVDANTGHWQAKTGTPMSETRELQYTTVVAEIPATAGALAAMVEPNVAWCDEHFAERVGGAPLNPPPSHVNWPYAQKDNAGFRGEREGWNGEPEFSHSYPERLWPKTAGLWGAEGGGNNGIFYKLGDLSDAVDLLVKHPNTRQCYVPMWFPEDLYAAAVEEVRVPCSLGWHFMVRKDKLHCFYPMRSVDLLRYFKDDLYMAGRLTQWMLEKVKDRTPRSEDGKSSWDLVTVGQVTMFMSSLHIFKGDVPNLEKKFGRKRSANARRT